MTGVQTCALPISRENDYLVVVSQDSDFVDLLDRHGPPPKVIHLRFGNQRVATTAQFLLDHFEVISAFVEDKEDRKSVV